MRYMLLFFCLLWAISCQSVTLKDHSPARYVVQPGDTLWEIANRYLEHPWEWKALWNANPQIKNPKHLYAGAVIELRYWHKRPYLQVSSNGTVKLSPYTHPMPAEDPIPAIPLADIKPFLNSSLVLDRDTLTDAPFIIAFMTEHLLGGQGDEVYVKNLCPDPNLPPGVTLTYGIYRPCGAYHDSLTQQLLGYKATLVGYAQLVQGGDPAVVLLTDIIEGVRLQDKVMPNNHPEFELYFEPKAPGARIFASIIDMPGDYTQGAVGLVAVIDRGEDAGLQPGDVLGVFGRTRYVRDPKYHYDKKPPCEKPCVRLPPERIGEVMVFRTFTHTSFALVVRSIRAIKLRDKVANP